MMKVKKNGIYKNFSGIGRGPGDFLYAKNFLLVLAKINTSC